MATRASGMKKNIYGNIEDMVSWKKKTTTHCLRVVLSKTSFKLSKIPTGIIDTPTPLHLVKIKVLLFYQIISDIHLLLVVLLFDH